MAAITKDQQKRINQVLKESQLIEKINILLIENGLADFSVETIQLQHTDDAFKFPSRDCPEGFELQWICHNGSNCELKCMPVG